MTDEEKSIKKLQKDGIETDSTIGGQFIKDQSLGDCIRKIEELFDEWQLRPLERDVVLQTLQKRRLELQQTQKMDDLVKGQLGGILGRFKK